MTAADSPSAISVLRFKRAWLTRSPQLVSTHSQSNPTGTSLRTVPRTGALSGGFTVQDGGVRRAVRFVGQVVPLSTGSVGVGYFLLPELNPSHPLLRSGSLTLAPP